MDGNRRLREALSCLRAEWMCCVEGGASSGTGVERPLQRCELLTRLMLVCLHTSFDQILPLDSLLNAPVLLSLLHQVCVTHPGLQASPAVDVECDHGHRHLYVVRQT